MLGDPRARIAPGRSGWAPARTSAVAAPMEWPSTAGRSNSERGDDASKVICLLGRAITTLWCIREAVPARVDHDRVVLRRQRLRYRRPAGTGVGNPVRQHDGWLIATRPGVVQAKPIRLDIARLPVFPHEPPPILPVWPSTPPRHTSRPRSRAAVSRRSARSRRRWRARPGMPLPNRGR